MQNETPNKKQKNQTKMNQTKQSSIPEKENITHDFYQKILSQPIIDLDQLREKAWAGIPEEFRPRVWRLFLDYEPVNSNFRDSTLAHKRSDYFDCLERVFGESQRPLWTNAQNQTEQQILRDLPRAKHPLLRCKRVKDLFVRVLFVWAVRHPASGYVQGMNDVLQPFFLVFLLPYARKANIANNFSALENLTDLPDVSPSGISKEIMNEIEADCFWCFSKFLDSLQDLYTKDQPGLYKMLSTIQQIVSCVDQPLATWIAQEDIPYTEFAFRWVNCLLVREFSTEQLCRIWDTYLPNHARTASSHIYVCAALLTSLSSKIVGVPHAEFVISIQGIDSNLWSNEEIEILLAQAYVYEKTFAPSPQPFKSFSLPVFNLKQ